MTCAKKMILLGYGILANLSPLFAGPVALYMQRQMELNQPLRAANQILESRFTQLIDHNDPSLGTFTQRYYKDETFSNSDKDPVFFYICGEAECTKRALNGAIRHYAMKYHAKLVALEHRYYGDSKLPGTFSAFDLRYLTTEHALDDLAYFQRKMSKDLHWAGKWIAFGGSYPGSLSAYYRLKFPYLVEGALASSAPVMAKEDFIEYDDHVTQVAGPQCAAQIRQVVGILETALTDKNKLDQMKALFDASAVQDPVDFLYLVADIAAAAVQYGQKDAFCSTLAQSAAPLQGYATFAKKLFESMGVTAVELTAQGALSENPDDYKNRVGMRQWYYQSCTEYGYWQNANPDWQHSTRSSLINLSYHHQVCQRLFGMNEPAQTQNLNTTYYYPLMDALVSHIYFTNGENDPWSTLSLAEKNGNAVNLKLDYYLIEGAAHCDDLHTPKSSDSASLRQARDNMEALIGKWLKRGTLNTTRSWLEGRRS